MAPQTMGNTSHRDAHSQSVQLVPLASTGKTVVTPAQECVCPVALLTLGCTTLLAVHSHSAQTSHHSHLTQATEEQVTTALGHAIPGTPWLMDCVQHRAQVGNQTSHPTLLVVALGCAIQDTQKLSHVFVLFVPFTPPLILGKGV